MNAEACPVPEKKVASVAPRPKYPDTATLQRALEAIPKLILWRIAGFEILRRIAAGEASRVHVILARYWETYELLQAARDVDAVC